MMEERNCTQGWIIHLCVLFFVVGVTGIPSSRAFEGQARDLTQLSIEELMNITVTSVSKKSQTISEAAAAVFVITREDIRRSGVTTIPDALRMVPGVQVGKLDANKWAVTARGSNGRFANKLLVLVDGRSVYTSIYSGVFWENVDTVLEDIDRIEVIRGPGASLWGANAVNGVINIITKTADKTKGVLVAAAAGTEEQGNVSLRYGGQVGEETPYRFYIKGFDRDSSVDSHGDDMADDWRYLRGGFRIDHHKDGPDSFTLQGDMFDGTNGEAIAAPTVSPPYSTTYTNDHKEKGGNILGRWTRTLSDDSELFLKSYYDRYKHVLHLTEVNIETVDVEFQHRFPIGTVHDVTWGLGYRFYHDDFEVNPDLLSMDPGSKRFDLLSAFLQDEMGFFDKQLRLTLGAKFEYNDYTHFEVQPNARLLWKPNERHSTWVSVSRAVRTPSRVESNATAFMATVPPSVSVPLPLAVTFYGSEDFDSETLMAYELGYRVQATSGISLDAALYYNDYKKLRETSTGAPVPGPSPAYMILPVAGSNETEGQVYGFELASDWKVSPWLSLKPAYTYMKNDIDYSANDILTAQDPEHQLSLRASFNLPHNLECDLWYRYVDDISDSIGEYDTLDVRLGWTYGDNLEFSIVGQNLLAGHHTEFEPEGLHTLGTDMERGVYGKVVWSFD